MQMQVKTDNGKEQRTHNSTYPKVAVQWLNQALCFYQSLYLADSEVLRNRHLRVAAKRYHTFEKIRRHNINKSSFNDNWNRIILFN